MKFMSFFASKICKHIANRQWGGLCAYDASRQVFSSINLFPTRHTNRPAFLSTEKEIIKAEHIIKNNIKHKGSYNDFRK